MTGLPRGQLFASLLADPKTPRFETSMLWTRAADRDTTVWAVAFGESFGVVRWARGGDGIQLDIAGAVLAQFDLQTPSTDLINADYIVGIPVSYRTGHVSGRVRVYHQSSHLGDEFLLRMHPQRINLSFESLEIIGAYDRAGWRGYAGGEYWFHRQPRELAPKGLHGGVEYRRAAPVLRIGTVGVGRVVAAVDVKTLEEDAWSPAWSAKVGVEFEEARATDEGRKHLSLLLQYYDGASPYGQFRGQDVRYAGVGLLFSF